MTDRFSSAPEQEMPASAANRVGKAKARFDAIRVEEVGGHCRCLLDDQYMRRPDCDV